MTTNDHKPPTPPLFLFRWKAHTTRERFGCAMSKASRTPIITNRPNTRTRQRFNRIRTFGTRNSKPTGERARHPARTQGARAKMRHSRGYPSAMHEHNGNATHSQRTHNHQRRHHEQPIAPTDTRETQKRHAIARGRPLHHDPRHHTTTRDHASISTRHKRYKKKRQRAQTNTHHDAHTHSRNAEQHPHGITRNNRA